nr:MAG TPA: hypothetical protein [Caudoviricetes sp.]DAY62734.1 MAG TPA: hypothetical protein [Caudoviricetes sp.]
MSLVRFPFEAPRIVVSKLSRYYYFFVHNYEENSN